jgi:hypothetical protein
LLAPERKHFFSSLLGLQRMRCSPGPCLTLLAAAVSTGGCGTIPLYSSVRENKVEGPNSVKIRAAIWDNTQIESKDIMFPFDAGAGYELDRYSSYGIEFERLITLGESRKYSVTFAYETRDMQLEDSGTPIQGEQIHAGMRRYFGDRVLTAFLSAQLIYHQSLDFPGELDLRESDDFLGVGAGGGLNIALSEHLSLETYVIYEVAPGVKTYKRRTVSPDAPADLEFNFSGPVAYIGLGYHF